MYVGLFRFPVFSRVYCPQSGKLFAFHLFGTRWCCSGLHIIAILLTASYKASKTDPFHMGCFLHIGRGEHPLCAIHSVLAYLNRRGDAPGPLFLFHDGRPLTCASLTSWLRNILASAGISGNFSSQSFRIGAATVTARNGIPDHQIQALGRWTSSAYLAYIRTPA